MPLKPADIEQKTFATAFKGYDLAEVDDFLDEVIATIRDLEERVASSGSGPASAATTTVDESAIGRALVAAQTAADKILEEARSEAEKIKADTLTDAERIKADTLTDAERIKADAVAAAESWQSEKDAKQAEARQTISALSERVESVRRELAALVNTLADGVDEMESVLDDAATFVGEAALDDEWEQPLDHHYMESVSLDSADTDDDDDVMVVASIDSASASDDDDDDDDFEAWQLGDPEESKP